jgi:hypothetical protein
MLDMKSHVLRIACLVSLVLFATTGCNAKHPLSFSKLNPGTSSSTKPIDPEQVQITTTSFAVRYITAMADVYEQVLSNQTTPEARILLKQWKLATAVGAMGDATNPNPVLGFMDLTVMVALTRVVTEDSWTREQWGPENVAKILTVARAQEAIIWGLAANYLTADQIAELHQLVDQWRLEHPGQRFVATARLADFSERPQANAGGVNLANDLFKLIKLDPFTGLDPAVKQVEESRILAERMFFYVQYMPTIISWQTDLLYSRMLAETLNEPQVKKALADTSSFTGNTTRFTDATAKFSEFCGQFAQSIEKFRVDLPQQQATLVKQVNDMIAVQREAALKQATTELDQVVATQRDAALKQANAQLAAQRDAAIQQLGATVQTQQDLIAKNLQNVLDTSIDRLYQRAYSVALIAAASLLAVLLVYRLIARRLAAKDART